MTRGPGEDFVAENGESVPGFGYYGEVEIRRNSFGFVGKGLFWEMIQSKHEAYCK